MAIAFIRLTVVRSAARAFLLILFLVAIAPDRFAADKSGVTPNTISLPSGPGSIEGLGEAFQPTLNTGTAKYSIALCLPPGTAGHAPSISLGYEGGAGNGPLGFGWGLPIPYVQRQCDKGIPRYVDEDNRADDDFDGEVDEYDERDRFISHSKEELVPQQSGYWFCENEGACIRYKKRDAHWEATAPTGIRMEFGVSPSARISDSGTGRIWRWLLERIIDTHGNTIVYHYQSFPGDENRNQVYCSGISYGPGAPPWDNFHFVHFVYEDRLDWFEDCRSGFAVRTGKRLKEIAVGTQGPTLAGHLTGDFDEDGTTDHLDRKYVFSYLDYDPPDSHWSLLHQVTLAGADGTSALPPTKLDYLVCDPPEVISASGHWIGGENEPPLVMDNSLVDLVDLNGDALPDVLRTTQHGGAHSGYLNQGERDTLQGTAIQWSPVQEVSSEDGLAWNVDLESSTNIAHLADMDGDGMADLVYRSTIGDVYYFVNKPGQGWGRRQPMSIQDFSPPSPFGNPNARTADIDFDKRMDIIESISVGPSADYRVWFNRGDQRYSQSRTVPQTSGLMFSLSGVDIADINGDRVPDIARVRPVSIIVSAGLGHGQFTDPITVPIPDFTLTDQQAGLARLRDITGDGLVDLVLERAAPGELWYWINQGNYTLSSRRRITQMPTGLGADPAIRWADLNGNGTVDLVYADSQSSPRILSVDIGRLLGCVPTPNILVGIDNGIGRTTQIHYEPSTKFALTDSGAGAPWPDVMPFPVSVVSEAVTEDSLGGSYVSQFRYHDGYYDAEEKEFRGFAHAENICVGDTTAPTLITHSYFNTGRQYESLKGSMERAVVQQEDGQVFSEDTTTWTMPPKVLMTGINGQDVTYAHPIACASRIVELGQGVERRLESEFAYDDFGNCTLHSDYGIVVGGDRKAFDDERITATQFALNQQDWLLRFPSRTEIRDEDGAVISRTDNYYDDETYGGDNLGSVAIGDLTLSREWIDPNAAGAFIDSIRLKYDAYGNAVMLLDPLAAAPGGVADLSGGHAREVAFDDRFQAYPERETIHVGNGSPPLVIEAEYDAGFGTVSRSLGLNGNATDYQHDVFPRITGIVGPGDTPAYHGQTAFGKTHVVSQTSLGKTNVASQTALGKTNVVNPTSLGSTRNASPTALGRTLPDRTLPDPALRSTQSSTEAAQILQNKRWASYVNRRMDETRAARDQILQREGFSGAQKAMKEIFDKADELFGPMILPGD